ncbi:MAG TPA: GDSL-type esterase/lipase family protein [Burkholderiales bacterium]|nr:GDSL-type esterase/lipase family protein [Burkholderiales bacterium]
MSASRLLIVALVLVAAACGQRPKLERLPTNAVVLAFGDSLTFGTGADDAESYPAQLQTLIGRRVVRAGVPGEVTAQALERLPSALDEYAPQLLLLCIGGNDFLRRLGNAQAERNVRAMVQLAKSRGVSVLLIGTPEPGLLPSPPAFYATVAKDLGVPYEDGVITEVLKDANLKSDPIHPNARGYRVIAERLAERLRKSGAL